MKLLTTNFLTCAVKSCKSSSASFPLHFRDAVLERTEIDFNPLFITNILPRLNWKALKTTANELGVGSLVPEQNPGEVADELMASETDGTDEIRQEEESRRDGDAEMEVESAGETTKGDSTQQIDEDILRKLHNLLLETGVVEGKLVCGNCGFEYPIKEGVANFLLPAHLV